MSVYPFLSGQQAPASTSASAGRIFSDEDIAFLRDIFPYIDELKSDQMNGGLRLYGTEAQLDPLRRIADALDTARRLGWEAGMIAEYGSLDAYYAKVSERYPTVESMRAALPDDPVL